MRESITFNEVLSQLPANNNLPGLREQTRIEKYTGVVVGEEDYNIIRHASKGIMPNPYSIHHMMFGQERVIKSNPKRGLDLAVVVDKNDKDDKDPVFMTNALSYITDDLCSYVNKACESSMGYGDRLFIFDNPQQFKEAESMLQEKQLNAARLTRILAKYMTVISLMPYDSAQSFDVSGKPSNILPVVYGHQFEIGLPDEDLGIWATGNPKKPFIDTSDPSVREEFNKDLQSKRERTLDNLRHQGLNPTELIFNPQKYKDRGHNVAEVLSYLANILTTTYL